MTLSITAAVRRVRPAGPWFRKASTDNFDVLVSRAGYAHPPDPSWAVVRGVRECRYIASFRKPTAGLLAAAIAQLIAVPLVELL